MNNKKTIRELYHCQYIVSEQTLYSLQQWYNRLLDKTIEQITVADTLRMLRQKLFLKVARIKVIEFLQQDPLAGELYAGEIIVKIAEIDDSLLKFSPQELREILEKALKACETYEWGRTLKKEKK